MQKMEIPGLVSSIGLIVVTIVIGIIVCLLCGRGEQKTQKTRLEENYN